MFSFYSFRPLSGSYISQCFSWCCTTETLRVSVPYRGATFLNRNKNIVGNSVRGFPSPIGELHFSIKTQLIGGQTWKSFRPLSGSYISQYFISCVCLLFIFVSVPYRGATFLNKNCKSLASAKRVSVPYRGATFLNNHRKEWERVIYTSFRPLSGSYISQLLIGNVTCLIKMFPSPIGELHFSIIHNKQEVWQWQSFRPLSGSYISQYIINNIKIRTWWFPSPIGELHFSIVRWFLTVNADSSFRPLSGSYISQWI